jgi:hypothetical protein
MDTSIFDKLQNHDWNLPLVDRSIDKIKAQKYINKLRTCDKNDANYAQYVLDRTIYVPFNEFKAFLIECFNLFKKEIGNKPFYILCDYECINSEHWLIILLWKNIKELNFKGLINADKIIPNKKYDILLIDDAIYSAITMSERIFDFMENIGLSKNKYRYVRNKLNLDPKKFNFHIVCPYVSKLGKEFIEMYDGKDWCSNTFYNIITIKPNNKYKNEIMYRFISCVRNCALYFDHRVACDDSTFRRIYIDGNIPSTKEYTGSLLNNNYSREKIDQFKRLYKEYLKVKSEQV